MKIRGRKRNKNMRRREKGGGGKQGKKEELRKWENEKNNYEE